MVYDYSKNKLDFTRKDGWRYLLNLRGSITIVDGLSGSGKSLLAAELAIIKDLDLDITGIDVSNITIGIEDGIKDNKCLYIIDRGDMILTDDVCETICNCVNARFLIFLRTPMPLGVSPNHVGEFVVSDKLVTLHFEFNEKSW